MDKVKIVRISRKDRETKYGIKPTLGIVTDKYGDKWLSTFKVQGTEDWKEGDTVEIYVSENNGYLNFSLAPDEKSIISELMNRVKKLEDSVFGAKIGTTQKTETPDKDEFDNF
jgi:hypothetical protein